MFLPSHILKERDFMNIGDFYNKVRQYALLTQTVESFHELDPYLVWNSLNITYPAFNCNINYIRRVGNNDIVNCTFYYGAKLKNDSSNIFEAQSNGFNTIVNVINHLRNDYELDDSEDIQIYPFHQQFSDILAGAYADVNIYVPVDDDCEDYDKEQSSSE